MIAKELFWFIGLVLVVQAAAKPSNSMKIEKRNADAVTELLPLDSLVKIAGARKRRETSQENVIAAITTETIREYMDKLNDYAKNYLKGLDLSDHETRDQISNLLRMVHKVLEPMTSQIKNSANERRNLRDVEPMERKLSNLYIYAIEQGEIVYQKLLCALNDVCQDN